MAFTYDLSTNIGQVRLAIGDTACDTAQLSDEEITALLGQASSWQKATLRAVDTLIAKYAMSSYDIRMGPRSESRGQRIENLKALKEYLAKTFGLEGALLATLGSENLTFSWVEEEDVEGEYWEG